MNTPVQQNNALPLHDHPTVEQHAAALTTGYHEVMRDAAYAGNIGSFGGIVAGYLNAKGDPYHPWSPADWHNFENQPKLPIFVQSAPVLMHVDEEAWQVVRALYELGVSKGARTALDLETAVNPAYVRRYGQILHWAGFRVWIYGSASTVFGNPALDGFWVADYVADHQPFMYDHPEVRATQYTDNPPTDKFDSSTVKDWILADKAHWWI